MAAVSVTTFDQRCAALFGSQDLTDEKTYIYRIYKYGNPMKLVTLELIKEPAFTDDSAGGHGRYTVVAVGRS